MKKLILSILFGCFVIASYAVTTRDLVYATRDDTLDLHMTIYEPNEYVENKSDYVIVYIHGGGFMEGSRNDSIVVAYCNAMSELGYTVASIDYRLGMDYTLKGMKFVKAIQSVIYEAVEDCAAAVVYLLEHEKIDGNKIILAGSSAGAITALQTDYMHSNGSWYTALLPDTLRFAGVMAYSGAIFSDDGLVKYARTPAPTFLFHGTKDNIVTYKQITLFNYGFFGANALVKRFEKYDYPYYIRRYKDLSHEVCHYGWKTTMESEFFIQKYIIEGLHLKIDEVYKNTDIQSKKKHYDDMRYEITHRE